MPSKFPFKPYTPPQNTTTSPFTSTSFTRQDSRPDHVFYSTPRFVTHIDDQAIASLRDYYSGVFAPLLLRSPPTSQRAETIKVLDFCTSHLSHYPAEVLAGARDGKVEVVGLGMNARELGRNEALEGAAGRRQTAVVHDLNADPSIASALVGSGALEAGEKLDVATCVVSIDYLTRPVEVLESLRRVVKGGGKGSVHLVCSNRCFPTKAVRIWLESSEEGRLGVVGEMLVRSGWGEVEIGVLSDGTVPKEQEGGVGGEGGMQAVMRALMGGGGRDPLWVVRGKNMD